MRTLLVVLLAAAAARAAAADTNAAAVSVARACKADLKKLCRPAPAGGPLKCLLAHKGETEPACRKALDSIKTAGVPAAPAAGGPRKSCLPEFMKVCSGSKSKDLKSCLKAHRGELSGDCQRAVDAQ